MSTPANWKESLHPSKPSLYFRFFMLVLHLGTSNLNYRNYEYGLYQLNQEHLCLRLDYFCSKYNNRGLGDLMRQVITGQSYELQSLSRLFSEGGGSRSGKKERSRCITLSSVSEKQSTVHRRGKRFDKENASYGGRRVNSSMVLDASCSFIEEDS